MGRYIQTVQIDLERAARRPVDSEGRDHDTGVDVVLRADAAKLKPGWKGNAIVEASVERVPPAQQGKGLRPSNGRFR